MASHFPALSHLPIACIAMYGMVAGIGAIGSRQREACAAVETRRLRGNRFRHRLGS